MILNNLSVLILILFTTSIASDEANNASKLKTKKTITREKKDSQRERDVDFESLPTHQYKNNGELSKSGRGCHIGGQSYFEGQFMPGVGGPCQACYCLRGEQQCTELRCKPPVKGCRPIFEEGACCPIRYDCESNEKQYIRSEVNGKLPRNGLLSDLRFKYNFDYDLTRDSDGKVMQNHIRIVRESQSEPVSEDSEVIATTDSVVFDEPATVPITTTTTARSTTTTTTMIKNVEVVANLNVLDFESTKMQESPPVEKHENTTSSKENILKLEDTNNEMIIDIPPVEEIPADIVPDTFDKGSVNAEDYAVSYIEDEGNFTGTTNTPTEFYDDYYYDYEELEDTTDVPRLSITEILNKLRNKNEGSIGSLADILPDPITGTNVDKVNIPEEPVMEKEQDKHNRVHDFVSYDVDVGASLIAGTDESDVIGVGQVIPIDLHTEEELPAIISSQSSELPPTTNNPSTTTTISSTPLSTTTTTEVTSTTSEKTKMQSTLFDTFFSLFRGKDPKDKEPKEPSSRLPPLPPPPPFLEKPPPPPPLQNPDIGEDDVAADIFEAPPSFFKPPPLPPLTEDAAPADITEDKFDPETKTNELDSELDFDAKPTIENEVRARPKPPNGATRNQLPPLRRRPTISEGTKPFNPGLFASRPKLPLLRSPTDVEEDGPVVDLPSDPHVEGGFSAIRPENETTTTTTTTSEKPEVADEKPTLPPSLPNLQIIPFVAADALVNQGSPPVEEQNGFSPKPFRNGAAQDCREGGKVWKNGETVARGDNDPCVVCRCHLGKVICQRYECAKVPEGCTAEEIPQEGECCPKITCDKSANVSIIDTLPSFRPIEEETKEEKKEESPSNPIRPSPFSHHNRRPPFIPGLRRPKPSNPILPLVDTKLPSAFRTTEEPVAEKREVEEAEAEESSKPGPIRPIRPISRHPLKPQKLTTTTKPFGGRPRPFSYRNRTGTRPPFVPPRRKSPGGLSNIFSFTKPAAETEETTPIPFTTTTSTTTTRIPAFILRSSTTLPEEIEETVRPEQIDAETFENIFADLLPKDKDSLPQPIHSDVFEEETQSDKPFILPPEILIQKPPEILIPKPLPPTNTITLDDGDITNLVQQEKFRFTANSRRPEVKFDRQPQIAPIRVQKPNKKLPEIPEVVKAQLPLGNDPILVSGLLELAGCNVYGRMFEVGEDIQEISGQCKACQCTKVGVQCLPIC